LIDWCFTPTLAVFQLYRGGKMIETEANWMSVAHICTTAHFPGLARELQ